MRALTGVRAFNLAGKSSRSAAETVSSQQFVSVTRGAHTAITAMADRTMLALTYAGGHGPLSVIVGVGACSHEGLARDMQGI